MKKVLCFCILMVTFSGCAESENDGKKVSVSVGKAPPTRTDILDKCLEGCVNKHCYGEKVVLLPSGKREILDNWTDEICTEKANQAITAKSIIANALGKLDGTAMPGQGTNKVKGGTSKPDISHLGEGYFWAVDYMQCRADCLNRFTLSVRSNSKKP